MVFLRALLILGGLELFAPAQPRDGQVIVITQDTIKAFRRLVRDMHLVEAYRIQSKLYQKEFNDPPSDEDDAKFQFFITRTLVAPAPEIETAFIVALAKRFSEVEAKEMCQILELPGGRKFISSMVSGMTAEKFDINSTIEKEFTAKEKQDVEELRKNQGFGKYILISQSSDYMADVVAILLSSPSFKDMRSRQGSN